MNPDEEHLDALETAEAGTTPTGTTPTGTTPTGTTPTGTTPTGTTPTGTTPTGTTPTGTTPTGTTPTGADTTTPPPEAAPDEVTTPQSTPLTDLQATIGGGVAGSLAPLATTGLNAYNGVGSIGFATIPWGLMIVFAAIGATVAYFLADRVRHHVFTCGIAAPFLVLGVVNSHKAGLTDQAEQSAKEAKVSQQKAEQAKEAAVNNEQTATAAAADANANAEKVAKLAASPDKPKLGEEAIKAVLESDVPAL